MKRKFAFLLLSAGFLLRAVNLVAAEEALPPEVQAAFEKGLAAAKQQEWELAIKYFDEARKTTPTAPALLFNQALAESRVPGRELRAIVLFEAYLCAAPDSSNAAKVRSAITDLQVKNEATLLKLLRQANEMATKITPPTAFDSTRIGGPRWGLRFAYENLVKSDLRAGMFDDAKWTAAALDQIPERNDAYRAIAEAEVAAGRFDDAKQTAARIVDKKEDESGDSAIMKSIAIAQAEQGKIGDAKETARTIRALSSRQDAFKEVACVQARNGKFREAKETLKEIEGTSASSWDYCYIAQIEAEAGRLEDANQTLAEAERVAGIQVEPLKRVANGYALAGNIEGARRIIARIDDQQARDCVLACIAAGEGRSGKLEDAKRTIREIKDEYWRASAYGDLIVAEAKAGKIDDAKQTLEVAKTVAARVESELSQSAVYYEIVENLTIAGLLEDAKRLADKIKNENYRSEAQWAFCKAKAKAGQFREAKETAARIAVGDPWRSSSFKEIAKAEAEAGKALDAKHTAGETLASEWLEIFTPSEVNLSEPEFTNLTKHLERIASQGNAEKEFTAERKFNELGYTINKISRATEKLRNSQSRIHSEQQKTRP